VARSDPHGAVAQRAAPREPRRAARDGAGEPLRGRGDRRALPDPLQARQCAGLNVARCWRGGARARSCGETRSRRSDHPRRCARARRGLGGAAPSGGARVGRLHAVSVGEAIAAAPLVEGLRLLWPALPLVMTTVTKTGATVVRERYAGLASHRFFPLDLPWATRRFVASLDPAFLVCMETELWPNMLRTLAARGVPVMIANGRISDRSYRRYRLLRAFMSTVL